MKHLYHVNEMWTGNHCAGCPCGWFACECPETVHPRPSGECPSGCSTEWREGVE